MADYYDTLGSILRDRLNDDTDPFLEAIERREGIYRTEEKKQEESVQKTKPSSFKVKQKPQTKPKSEPELVRVPVPPALIEDFAVLQVPSGVPLAYCKQSWKRLLKKYHPDFIEDVQAQVEAAAVIRRLNRSYKRIETWFLTGKISNKH